MKDKKAFTLIELLVVIAIIGLLLSILIPALQYVKQQATAIICGSNQTGLGKCWYLYQEDNDGRLVGASNYYNGGRASPYRWVEVPLEQSYYNPGAPPEGHGDPVATAPFIHEWELNGIRAGKLYPYTETEKLYHCPNDKYYKKNPTWAAYISYAGSGLMNSEDFSTRTGWPGKITAWRNVGTNVPGGGTLRLGVAEKFSDISAPGQRYVFVEEDYVSHGQQVYAGGFVLMQDGNYWNWWDWPAPYHNDRSTLAFADGHTEKRRWNQQTVDLMTRVNTAVYHPGNEDLEWMIRGYMAMGIKKM